MNDFLRSLSPENQLVIALCRLSFTLEHKEYIEDLVKKVTHWDHFTHQANEHGVAAIVCNNLKELGFIDRLPEKEAAFLRNAYLKSLSRNTHLYEKLEEVKKYLAEIDIKPVLLKGMALELTAYGNMGLRQMNDIDLYIDRENCLKAWNHLIYKGYKPEPLKSHLYKKIILDIGKHLPELYSDGISIELHHRLFDTPCPLPPAPCQNKIGIDGLEYALLPIEYHFLFLIKHLHYHETNKGESQLRLYNDLCQLMMQCTRDIRSSGILDLAREIGIKDALFEKFYTLQLLWGMPLPDDLFKSLTDQQKYDAEAKILNFILKPKGHKVANKGKLYRVTLDKIPGFGNKLRYIVGDLFPSLAFMKIRYKTNPSIIAILYYPLRLAKLLYLILP